jgi:acyl-CoA reductase-like NAD-dependent aldehyde dehydrogenase
MSVTQTPGMSLKATDRFFIGGEWVTPSTPSQIDVINPTTEELLFRVAEAQPDDMSRAVAAARDAFDRGPWPRLSHEERSVFLRAIAAGLDERGLEISQIWTGQMGVLHSLARLSIPRFGDLFRYYADLATNFAFEESHVASGGESALLVREPVGVVGAIIPWNGPLLLTAHKVAPALLAGCTVIIKSSPEAPGEAYVLAEIAESVGLPPGVLNVVTADRPVSELLVRDERVDKIAFTGSTAAGRRIGSLCGKRVARVTLELGGKSAAVILDDYDIAAVADSIATTEIAVSGQVCSCLSRIIVSRRRHDELVEALSEPLSKVRVGDPFDPQIQMGPVAMRRQRDRVEGYIAKGREEGATLATGGGRPADLPRGFFIEPTVFGNVESSSTIAQEEIFGPVFSVIPVDDERQAIEVANDTIYGLNASVFTNDADHGVAVARQIRSGTVALNAHRNGADIAFGGYKQSGIGREGGREGLLPYLETKTIITDRPPE